MEQQENSKEQLIKESQINEAIINLEEEISNLKRDILKKEMLLEKIKQNIEQNN